MGSRSIGYFLKSTKRNPLTLYQYFGKRSLYSVSNPKRQTDCLSGFPRLSGDKCFSFDIFLNPTFTPRKCSTNIEYFDNNLGRLLSHIATDIKNNKKVHKNDVMNAFNNMKSPISERDGILLIRCCSSYLFEEVPEGRMELLSKFWIHLLNNSEIGINHYNELLKSYVDNKHKVIIRNFIQEMHPHKPNNETYLLLLKSACQHGDVNQMTEIMENIKITNIPYTEDIFCTLMEGYAENKDLDTAFKIVDKMKSLSVPMTTETEKTLLKVLILCGEMDNFKKKLSEVILKQLKFSDNQAMEIIECVSVHDMKAILPECFSLFPNETLSAPSMSSEIKTFCLKLINNGHSDVAYFLYSHLSAMDIGPTFNHSTFGRQLLRQSVKACNSFSDVIPIIKGLLKSKRNEYSIQTAYEASLHFKKYNISMELLKVMKEYGIEIRSHFFWPLLIGFGKTDGESGVFEIIKLMKSYDLKIDNETMSEYVIPYINMSSPQDVIKKCQDNGLSLTESFTPVVLHLIKKGEAREASEMCELIEGKLDPEVLLNALLLNYISFKDTISVHNILRAIQQKSRNSNRDWIGNFLISFISYKKWEVDLKYFESLVVMLHESDTRISAQAVELCAEYLNRFKESTILVNNIKEYLSKMVDVIYNEDEILARFPIPTSHDKMTIPELEGHLVQLESKHLNSRGVLRKLFQQYCQQGDLKNAEKILKQCKEKKIQMSDGMMASAISLFLKSNDMEQAEKYMMDLKKVNPKFDLDEHKIIDYATLLVKNDQITKACDVLQAKASQVKIRGGNNIEMNCWNLLNSVGLAYGPEKIEEILGLLNKLGYCKFSNILLGPQIRAYLNRSDIIGAVDQFVKCAKTYRKTPLKHEILCILVSGSNDGNLDSIENNKFDSQIIECLKSDDYKNMLVKVQSAERRVHGFKSCQVSLICAFAEMGLTKPLRNLLLSPSLTFNQEDLFKECERFANNNKINSLVVITDCLNGVKNFDAVVFYELIMKTLSRNGDLTQALELWDKMNESHIKPSHFTAKYLADMLQSHKKNVPDSLTNYLNKSKEKVLMENV